MTAIMNISNEAVYGPNGEQVVQLMIRLSNIDWFSAFGKQRRQWETEKAIKDFVGGFDIHKYDIKWITKDELLTFLEEMKLEESSLWLKLQYIPEQIKNQAEQVGRLDALLHLADEVPVNIFHYCFDRVFHELGEYGLSMVETAVCFMMYIGGLACSWEMIADIKGWENNPFLPLIDVLEHGHWPLGLIGEQFYVI
ncbi:hypothetical protein [Bacillus alveayuensis]|jgi:hypothetical protein|uniref:hypothetical protein n=1 Tax=Aeribacillus alveayuensis TaxID=279215 RepID=UPI0005CC98E9|nr:hypothetical protein [Bacillus alveayuensis]